MTGRVIRRLTRPRRRTCPGPQCEGRASTWTRGIRLPARWSRPRSCSSRSTSPRAGHRAGHGHDASAEPATVTVAVDGRRARGRARVNRAYTLLLLGEEESWTGPLTFPTMRASALALAGLRWTPERRRRRDDRLTPHRSVRRLAVESFRALHLKPALSSAAGRGRRCCDRDHVLQPRSI
jgi:hypothetical protein